MRALIFVFSLCFLTFNSVQAASAGDVLINEIAWMGALTSANDEWIELFNNTPLSINLDGWTLKADNESPEIKLTGSITGQGFWLLERTDDSSVSNITADQIYTGALNNKSEKLELRDGSGNLIDSVDGAAGWPAGDNSTKQTMERRDFQSWQTSREAGGTPKSKNSAPAEEIVSPAAPLPPSSEQPKTIDSQKKFEENNPSEDLAAAGELIQQTQNKQIYKPSFPILIALVLVIFSGAMVFILKKNLK